MKQQGENNQSGFAGFFGALLKGMIISVILCLAALAVGSFVLSSTDLGLSSVGIITTVISSIGAFAAALAAARSFSHAGIVIGAVCGCLLFGITALLGFVIYGGLCSDCYTDLIFMLLFGIIGGIIGVRRVKGRKF